MCVCVFSGSVLSGRQAVDGRSRLLGQAHGVHKKLGNQAFASTTRFVLERWQFAHEKPAAYHGLPQFPVMRLSMLGRSNESGCH